MSDGGEAIDTGPAVYQTFFVVGLLFLFALLMLIIVNKSISADIISDEDTNNLIIAEAVRHCFLHEEDGRIFYDTISMKKWNQTGKLEECVPDDEVEVKLFKGDNLVDKLRTPGGKSETLRQYLINVKEREGVHLLSVGLRE